MLYLTQRKLEYETRTRWLFSDQDSPNPSFGSGFEAESDAVTAPDKVAIDSKNDDISNSLCTFSLSLFAISFVILSFLDVFTIVFGYTYLGLCGNLRFASIDIASSKGSVFSRMLELGCICDSFFVNNCLNSSVSGFSLLLHQIQQNSHAFLV